MRAVVNVLQRSLDHNYLGNVAVHSRQLALETLPPSCDCSKEIVETFSLYREEWITFNRIVTRINLAPPRDSRFLPEVPGNLFSTVD